MSISFCPCLPLVTLQAKKFNSQGILAAIVTGESDDEDVKRGVYGGKYDVVFFTPEILINSKRWRKVLTSDTYIRRLKALVVDEAHCVSKW